MKKLFLLRHAKSDYPNNVNDDHARPLNKRGEADCRKIARYLKENNISPQAILASDATRTTSTINNLLRETASATQVQFLSKLYLATPGEILKEVAKIDNSLQSAMIVAHNPGIEQLARILIKDGKPESLAKIRIKYPTCALTCLELDTDSWSRIDPQSGYLANFITPKML
jgi:phosphohistidine phosphatase